MNAISVKNISYSYNKVQSVVNHISFDVPVGAFVSIIGHNGSGKSTISKLLAGLLEADSGTIKIFDQDLTAATVTNLRKRIGIVFQNPDNQFIGATVQDDIAFGLENRQVKRDEMIKLIDDYSLKVEMKDFLDKEPSNLSGGQKQRVAIAGVLAMHPDILILDEATAMLDPKGKSEILDIILKMKNDNPDLTVISITHNIEETMKSDLIFVINEGKLVLSGTPTEVYSHEQELKNISLSIPFFYRMKNALISEGIACEDAADTKELVERICR